MLISLCYGTETALVSTWRLFRSLFDSSWHFHFAIVRFEAAVCECTSCLSVWLHLTVFEFAWCLAGHLLANLLCTVVACALSCTPTFAYWAFVPVFSGSWSPSVSLLCLKMKNFVRPIGLGLILFHGRARVSSLMSYQNFRSHCRFAFCWIKVFVCSLSQCTCRFS